MFLRKMLLTLSKIHEKTPSRFEDIKNSRPRDRGIVDTLPCPTPLYGRRVEKVITNDQSRVSNIHTNEEKFNDTFANSTPKQTKNERT